MYIAGNCVCLLAQIWGARKKAKGGKKDIGVISHWPFQSPPFSLKKRIKSDSLPGILHGAKNRFNRLKLIADYWTSDLRQFL
jgi:hypothetical protein